MPKYVIERELPGAGQLSVEDEDAGREHAETYLAVMLAKAEVAAAGLEVCDLAMDVAGGPAFFKGSVIERAYRDFRAIKFYPLTRRRPTWRPAGTPWAGPGSSADGASTCPRTH